MKNLPILKWALIVGIVVVLNLFFNYAISLVYDAPEYEKFCPQQQVNIPPKTQAECVAKGGAWTEGGDVVTKGNIAVPAVTPTGERVGWCDVNFTCNKELNDAQKLYNRNVFIALVVLGVASLVAGFFFSEITAVSLGLSFGGVLSFIIGSIRYWSDMDDYLRVIILGLALVALIWLGVKKIKD